MSKRVFELAKELNTPTKDLIKKISKLGIKIKGNFSGLTEDQVSKIKKDFLEPTSRIKETLVSNEGETKKVRRRIISAKKATAGKKIRKSLNIKDEPLKEDIQTRKDMKVTDNLELEEALVIDKERKTRDAPVKETIEEEKTTISDEKLKVEKKKSSGEDLIVKEVTPKAKKTPSELEEVKAEKVEQNREKSRQGQAKLQKAKKPEPATKAPEADKTNKKDESTEKDSVKKGRKKKDERKKAVESLESEDNDQGFAKKKKDKTVGKVRKKDKFFKQLIEEEENEGKPAKFAGKKRFKIFKKESQKPQIAKQKKVKHTFNPRKKELVVGKLITVGDLAKLIGIRVPEIIKTLMSLEIMATITQSIDGETAALIAGEHNIDLKVSVSSLEDAMDFEEDHEENLAERPPVVTIMGHVDHGKTKLLDTIRNTNVVGGEAGGITQHIGAYHVDTPDGLITFLDTPGHAAFTAMRARGADVTDIVILVIAADDGPRPQTIEAIRHAKAADVSIIVAINKCDKPEANPDRVVQQLMGHEIVAEEFGGDVPVIKLSAKTGKGISKLLEMVHLQTEMMELQADPSRMAQGVVIESRLDKGRGNTATILIQTGSLRIGDNYVVGTEYGKVRAMWNDRGKKVLVATPSMPVEIVGLNGLPKAGDKFNVGKDEKQVRQLSSLRTIKEKEKGQAIQHKKTLENIFDSLGKVEKSMLSLIIKADVIGSAEALADSLSTIGNEEVAVKVVHNAVGAISSTDVTLAAASNAIIIGFNTRPDPAAKKLSKEEGIEIRQYSVIYEAIDDVKKALEGMLKPVIREEFQGRAQVLEVFNIPKIGFIAGSKVVEGKVVRSTPIRVLRDNVVIHDGQISSLKRFKDDAKEVMTGFECGIGIETYKDIRVGDEIESYSRLETSAKL